MLARVISLKNCTRRETINTRLKGIPVELFDAIDIQSDERKNIFDSTIARVMYGREIMPNEVGCTISHYLVISEFVRDNSHQEWLIIFEDDVVSEPPLKIFLDQIDNITLEKPVILLLGHTHTQKNTLKLQRLKQPLHDITEINNVKFGINDHINYCGTLAYAVNISAAKLISAQNSVFWLSDDWHKIRNFGIQILHSVVPLAYEDPRFESTIGNHQYNFHSFKHRPVFQIVKVIISQFRHVMKHNDPNCTYFKFRP